MKIVAVGGVVPVALPLYTRTYIDSSAGIVSWRIPAITVLLRGTYSKTYTMFSLKIGKIKCVGFCVCRRVLLTIVPRNITVVRARANPCGTTHSLII